MTTDASFCLNFSSKLTHPNVFTIRLVQLCVAMSAIAELLLDIVRLLEVCALPKRVLQSLDFTVNRVLMKLFKSSNIVVIEQCRYFFHIELPSVQLQRRFEKFLANAADDDKVY